MGMTRKEHVKWCKKRALELAEKDQLSDAVASMISDLSKHEETKHLQEAMPFLFAVVFRDVASNSKIGVINWINGFAE